MAKIITPSNLLSEIASDQRLEILRILDVSELKPSEIAKKANISIQAITRHLDRLQKTNLIEKTPNGVFAISTIGKIVMSQIPFFEFLAKHRQYFKTHDFTGVPDHLVARIGDLQNCELEKNFMKSMQRARDMCENAKHFLSGATFTIPLEFFDTMLVNLKQGCTIETVFGTNTIVPKGFSKYAARKECLKYKKNGQVKEKIVKNVPLAVAVTENEAHLMFPNKDLGYSDVKGVFFSKDPKFIRWCLDLFEYYRNMPEVKNFKLKEN